MSSNRKKKIRRMIPREYRPIAKEAMANGWTIELTNSTHLRWQAPDGQRFQTAATPGDTRSVGAVRADYRRALRGELRSPSRRPELPQVAGTGPDPGISRRKTTRGQRKAADSAGQESGPARRKDQKRADREAQARTDRELAERCPAPPRPEAAQARMPRPPVPVGLQPDWPVVLVNVTWCETLGTLELDYTDDPVCLGCRVRTSLHVRFLGRAEFHRSWIGVVRGRGDRHAGELYEVLTNSRPGRGIPGDHAMIVRLCQDCADGLTHPPALRPVGERPKTRTPGPPGSENWESWMMS